MALVTAAEGDLQILKYMLNNAAQGNVVLKLYTNNYTPTTDTTTSLASFTEATAAGYSAKTLTGASWTFTYVSGIATASYAAQSFTFTTGVSCYGLYVVDSTGAVCLWAEKFPSVFTIPAGGGTIQITPKINAN